MRTTSSEDLVKIIQAWFMLYDEHNYVGQHSTQDAFLLEVIKPMNLPEDWMEDIERAVRTAPDTF